MQAMGAAGAANDIEYINRLLSVMKRHPKLDVKPIVQHKEMKFEPHEKEAIKGLHHDLSHEEMAKMMASKGQVEPQIRTLHKVASGMHMSSDYQAFADDLAQEFHF